ncbi:TIGR01440 family protein [Effusibacillus lacus]|uniref:UPF0340 protein EFBL_1221 n=1 Tax=Effusibacillus lacus TaxID=1348429 RepID=A0A292YGF3_9BACL|nr:TIGR01440 family protein [Effusibacillus lacus]TCS71836.1 uncharacterized protein (TIGR01440 family) [Effusibacillus lacus]GAX89597.1 TIGR01440 family protein [Effusibacillus lacus]
MLDKAHIQQATRQAIDELQQVARLSPDQILVIGASSSEVIGERIGTSGSTEVAGVIVDAVLSAREFYGFHVAFQCCEHLNRALVVERSTQKEYRLEEVTVVPVPQAGGAVASAAFKRFREPVMVESIQAHAGIDIGDTFIGMHLRPVAVPVRTSIKTIGQAHVTMARTRPKLIGGARAVYIVE